MENTCLRKRKLVKSIKPDFTVKVLEWLVLCSNAKTVHLDLFKRLAEELETIIQTRGAKEGIRIAKAARLLIFSILSSDNRSYSKAKLQRSMIESGLPSVLKAALTYVVSRKMEDFDIRLLLTLFYSTRALKLPLELKVKTITDLPRITVSGETEFGERPVSLNSLAKSFWKDLGVKPSQQGRVPRRLRFKTFHLTTKAGPQGHALWSSIEDFRCLPESLKKNLIKIGGPKIERIFSTLEKFSLELSSFINEFSSPIASIQKEEYISKTLKDKKKFCKRNPTKVFKPKKFRVYTPLKDKRCIRRISLIPDEEGKTRVVAIMDYWSQTVLLPLHNYLFGFLKRIPQDCTFKQGAFVDKIRTSDEYYSIDLTAFTDRLPVSINFELLKVNFGEDYAEAWRDIMVGYPFALPNSNEEIRYSVGNPMGAYSSWNSSALTHHFLIYICCKNIGVSWSNANYVLLGDDLCIGDKLLAQEYFRLIERLDMPYSKEKTHISSSSYEFAKRFIINGVEMTPFPIKALWSSRRNPIGFFSAIINESNKGWFTKSVDALKSYDCWLDVCKFSSSFRKRKITKLLPTHQILMALQGRIPEDEALKPLIERSYPSIAKRMEEKAKAGDYNPYLGLIKSCVMQCFTESFEDDNKHTLGQIALEMMMFITQYDECDVGQVKEAIPLLQVYGSIEESYIALSKEVYTLDTLMGGDWKLHLKALILPISDRIFYLPNQELQMYASSKIADKLLVSLESLVAYPQLI